MSKKNRGFKYLLLSHPHLNADDVNGNILNAKRHCVTMSLDLDSNATTNYFKPKVLQASDYYPFGSVTPGRQFSSASYRYGFNGKEKDDEAKGAGASYDYGFRIYDPRLGKFLSMDPLTSSYPWFTPYQFAGNEPISNIDLDGLEKLKVTRYINDQGNQYKTLIEVQDAKAALSVNYGNLYDTDNSQIPEAKPSEQNLTNFISEQEMQIFTATWDADKKTFKNTSDGNTPLSVQFNVQVPTEEASSYNVYIDFGDVWEDKGKISTTVGTIILTNNKTGEEQVVYDVFAGKAEIGKDLNSNHPGVKELKKTLGQIKTNTDVKVDVGTFTDKEFKEKFTKKIVSVINSIMSGKPTITTGAHAIAGEGGNNVNVDVNSAGGEINNASNIPANKKK